MSHHIHYAAIIESIGAIATAGAAVVAAFAYRRNVSDRHTEQLARARLVVLEGITHGGSHEAPVTIWHVTLHNRTDSVVLDMTVDVLDRQQYVGILGPDTVKQISFEGTQPVEWDLDAPVMTPLPRLTYTFPDGTRWSRQGDEQPERVEGRPY